MNGETFSGEFAFSQPVINIGSDAGNDIVLIGSSVGTFHAMMHYDSNRWFVASLDPEKRTFVNGHSIDANGASLQSGSVLTIGDYRMTVRLNGINTDIIVQFQGQLGAEAIAAHQVNAEANIQLAINGTPPSEINAGGSVEYELTVTNAGPLVANMQLQLQGVPTAWVQIIPPVINLNEGRRGSFVVRISPPRDSSAEAGVYNIHFVATSPNYPRETATADTALNVLPYTEFMLNGPMPRVLKLSRRKPSQLADLVVINNSNSTSNFMVQTYDDANELQFTYERGGAGMYQNQEIVSVRAGDHVRVPIMVTSKKIPFVAFSSHVRHYSVNVTPSDRPGDTQSVIGEVNARPFIRTYVLLLLVALVAILGLFVLQPYIRQFDGADGKRTQVVLSGSSAQINWRVSPLASKVTMDDGSGPQEVAKNGTMYVSPSSSTTYVLRSENILSRLLGFEHVKSLQVLSIPNRPKINLFTTDAAEALYNQTVTFSWAVEPNADKATIIFNKQAGELPPEQYSASQQEALTSDTLVAIKAENSSGYEMKSLFVSVSPDVIDLLRYAVWVRPNGIAVPNDNDTRKQTRWGSLQLTTDTTSNTLKPALSNPQPAAQSNTLEIPDNFNNTAGTVQSYNPEQLSLNGQAIQPTPYSYTPPVQGAPSTELLVGPSVTRERTDRNPSDSSGLDISSVMHQDYAPVTSPEGTGNGFDPNFTIKLMEVIEDPMSESGYRVIDYFPDYQLQPGEQILVEWNVDGVAKVKIDNLSDDLKNSGAEYANPEKSVTYVLHAQVGDVEQAYSLPVRVAGDADNGEGSGLNCELKANATTLKVPGTVMLTWKGGGNGRVQLVSSAKAEADSADAEKKKEAEAKEKGEKYEKPTQPQPLEGGVIADYLQPSGFMRVNVDKQTIFMLNCYDSSNNVICTKSVEVKYEGGNDKADLKLEIVSVTDSQGVERPVYTVGQTVQYTVKLSGYDAKKIPGGNVTISDSVSSCSVTLPVVTCSVQAKKTGKLVLTAVYSGDDNYNKATAYGTETVIDKLTSTMDIQAALKPAADRVNMITQLKYDAENEYGLVPSGTITFTAGSGTCDLDVLKDTLTCDGKVVEMENDPYWFKITDMLLGDAAADRITAAYKGDDYFSPSTSKTVLFQKIPTTLTLSGNRFVTPFKTDSSHLSFGSSLSWTWPWDPDDEIYKLIPDIKPTGTITYTIGSGTCVLDISTNQLNCESSGIEVNDTNNIMKRDIVSMMLKDTEADRMSAAYSGDSLFNASASAEVLFNRITTETTIYNVLKETSAEQTDTGIIEKDLLEFDVDLTWIDTPKEGSQPTGTITFNIGNQTCTMNVTSGAMTDCEGTVTKSGYDFHIEGLVLTDEKADSIKAVYSGDSVFVGSESQEEFFSKLPTSIEITSAYKSGEFLANIVSQLTWNKTDAEGKMPEGTISFIASNSNVDVVTCVYTIKDETFDCKGSITLQSIEGGLEISILEMGIINSSVDRVRAMYSGDANFMSSTSTRKLFETIETETTITEAFKTNAGLINVITEITWDDQFVPKVKPTGIVKFTSGTGTCTLTISSEEEPKIADCEVEIINIDGTTITIDGLKIEGAGDTIKAEYSGDEIFLASSSFPYDFRKAGTTIEITEAAKFDEKHANLVVNLTLDEIEGGPFEPMGTITFTTTGVGDVVTGTCKLDLTDLKKPEISCDSENVDIVPKVKSEDGKYKITIDKMLLADKTSDRIKAEYSGDIHYNGSASKVQLFTTVPTTITVTNAYRPFTSYASFDTLLSWDDDTGERKPSGTITFTTIKPEGVGEDDNSKAKTENKCVLTLSDPLKMDCDGTPELVGNVYEIRNMLMSDYRATRVKAEYNGDGYFLPSVSTTVLFETSNTTTVISNATKDNSNLVAMDLTVKGTKQHPDGRLPLGTVTIISGSKTCILDFTSSRETAEFKNCSGNPNYDKDQDIFKITKLDMGESSGNTIYAVYSGENAFFLGSTSAVVDFFKINTVTKILEAYKPVASSANIIASLTRVEKDWEKAGCNVEGADCPGMTGTLTYTLGSQTCVLDIVKMTMDCSGTPSVNTNEYSILNLLLSSQSTDRVKVTYSGDAFYNGSSASETLFNRVLTETVIITAGKRTEETEDGKKNYYTDFTVELTWLEKDTPKDGATPTGTLTFIAGNTTCEMDVVTGTMLSCGGKVAQYGSRYEIEGMGLGNEDVTSIRASYSGDSAFHPSTSQPWKFDTIDTEIEITRAFKPDDTMANLVAELKPIDYIGDKKPTGTVTFIASNSMVDTVKCEHELETDNFSCQGMISEEFTENYIFTIENMPIGQISADRIRAEYSGDDFFNPSTSKMVLFKTVGTAINIRDASKTADNVVSLTTSLTWDEFISGGIRPSGSIIYTSGTRTCTLDISGEKFKFTDCDGSAEYTYSETDKKLSIMIENLPMTGAGNTIKAVYSGSGAYLKSESPEVSFAKIGTELDIVDSKTYKTDTSHVNVEVDLKWKKEDAGEQDPSGTVTFTIGSTACTLNITANTLSGCEAAKFNVTGPEDDPEDPAFSKYHLTLGDVLFEGTADRVKAEYSGDTAFNPSSSTSLFKTVPTEITIINEDPNKPYRPNAGYANFNTILTWDEEQAAGRTPGGTITFTPVNSTACVYTLSTGKMDCEGKVTYVTDHYEIRNLLMSNSNSDRIQAKYSGDGFFEESTSTTVLFDMSDTATKIMNAAISPENVVDMNVSVTSTKPHPDGRQPVGTIVFTSGKKTCTMDILSSPARFTDCEGTVVYNADENIYQINGLVMGDTAGTSIFAKYSGDSFFNESTSPTVDFTKVDTTLEITNAYKPGSQNLLDLVVVLSWDKTEAENKAPTGTIQFTIGSDTCVLSKLETDEPGFNCKGENTKITRVKSEPGDSDTWSYTWTIANILLTNNTADRVKAEYKGDSIFNPSSSDTVLFKTVPTEIAVSSAFKTGTDHADITAALSWDNGLAEGRVPTGTIKFTAGSGSCTLDIETKALSCEPKTGTVSDDRKTYSVIGMLLDDKTADRVSVEYSGDGFFEPSVSSKVLFQTIPTDLMISNAKLTPPGFIRLTAELSWIDTPPVGKTPGGTIKFTSGTGTCTLDISASPVKFTDCDGRVESTVSEDGKKQTYTITNMFFGGKAGTDVKAEYSGDGLFLASASDKLAFDKLDTTLVISDAYKPETSLANSTVTLSWLEEDAGGNKPSGTVKLTIGGSTCTLNMADDSFSCSGESTKITRAEGETVSDSKTYAYIRWVFENVLLSDEKADRIKAEYSGDTFFNDSSSVTVLFKTIPTDLTITNGDKKSSGLIDLTMDLSWTDTPPANVLPDGTIKLTSGSSTCTVSLSGDTARLTDCQGNSPVVTVSADRKKLTISMTGLNMGEKTGDGVKAEYSGNSIFLASASDSLFFNKINTTLTIDPNEVYKSGEGLLNMISKLSWDAEKAGGKLPTGTITYTIGSDSCVLDIETKAFTCSGTDTDIQRTDADGSFEWAFKNILLSNNTADRVKAVYSGDGAFNTSASITVLFKTVETTLNIYDQSKSFSGVNMTVDLSWVDVAPKDKKPAGTIKLIAGSSSCSMDMNADPLKLDCDANASVSLLPPDPDDPQKVSYRIENFRYFGAGVESIKAQYSGDGCFLPSESNKISFDKIDTKLTIDSSAISKPDEQTANLNVTLSSDDVQAIVDEMTGTIKFIIGSDTCTYDITAQTFTCSGETTKITEVKDPDNRKITWTFENVVLSSGNNADRVKAEYSGNDGYNPSTSPIVFFTKVNTSLVIPSATKSNAGLITMTGEFSWIETPPAGKIPGGTIKFVSGTAVCTLDINADPLKFSDCPGTVTVNKDEENKKYTYTVTDMNMGDKVGDEIKLEYSGDGTFQPSSSDSYSFVKVDTKLVIDANETFRTNDLTATVLASLTWTKADADGKTPTGTVKFTIGPDVCTLDIVSEEFNCYGAATIIKIDDIPTEATDPETGKSLSIKEIMLSTGNNADRIKAEYSGDAIFNPSASSTVLFKTIETELDIHDQKKLATGLVNLATDLTWAVTPPTGKTPAGTIKYTSGSVTCTLNLASKKFTDCEGTAEITFGDGIAAVQVTNLNMGKNNKETTIKAEYSGDGCFLTSVSSEEELVYVKLIPELEIIRAYKPGDPSLVNMIVTLEWDEEEAMEKKPTGTITFTMDKNTCNLTITGDPAKDTISCSGSDTKIERDDEDGQYKWTMKNVLLTDSAANSVRGKYNGDDVFDTDESNTVKFYTVETEISILNDDDIMPYKPVEGYVNFSSALSWDNEDPALDWDMSGTKRLPGGTITYTPMAQDSDAGKCVLTISTGKLSCEGAVTGSVIQYGISRMLLPNFKADRIKAEYSGDGFYEPSISTTVLFRISDTTTTIMNAKKTQDNLVFMDIEIRGALEHPEGRKPLGTVKITSGSKSCTLDTTDDPANAKFTGCNGTLVYDAENGVYHISDLDMGKDAGATINAVYSGDNAFFNGSTSPTIDFLKLNTYLSVEKAFKSSSTTVDITLSLRWDIDEKVSDAPSGTVKLTIGSDTCSLNIQTKEFNCSGKTTHIERTDSSNNYIWTLTNILLSGTTADRVNSEYSGDAIYNPSNSKTVLFKTVPTTLIMLMAEKTDVNHASVSADLTWDNADNTEERTPTGTVKFNVGSGSCSLDIVTKALNCEPKSGMVDESESDKRHMEILSMLLDDKSADRVNAEYSGDGYFKSSTSTKILFQKRDPGLEITKIVDENGNQYSSYFVPGQKIQIVTNMTKAVEDLAPTGTITLYMKYADKVSSACSITLPANTCQIKIPEELGETNSILIEADYEGDVNYYSDVNEKSLAIKKSQTLKIAIEKITDSQGIEHDQGGFIEHIGQDVIVSVKITEYDENQPPTGTITVKIDSSSCKYNYPDESSCKLSLPSELPSPLTMKEYDVTAEYSGNTYYEKAEADSWKINVSKYDIGLEITSITNVEKDQDGNTVYIEQPYYVYDIGDKLQNPQDEEQRVKEGQTIRICANLKNAVHGDPEGSVMISINDEAHDDGEQLVSFSVADGCGTYKVRKYTGQITLTASYPGDTTYLPAKAQKTMVVQNRIDPGLTLLYASRFHTNPGKGYIIFAFLPDSDIPEDYEDVSLVRDNTVRPETTQKVTFKFGTATCVLDLAAEPLDKGAYDCSSDDTEIIHEGNYYLLDNVYFADYTANEITAEYDGNRYYYKSSSEKIVIDVEEGGYTRVSLFDVLKIDYPDNSHKGHMFLNAVLSYDQNIIIDNVKQKPKGSLIISVDGEEKICPFNLETEEFDCGTVYEQNNNIRFIIKNIDVSNSENQVGVSFRASSDTDPFENSDTAWSKIITESCPTISFTSAEKTSNTTADLTFTIANMGALTKSYDVYNLVRLESQSESVDTTRPTCTFDNNTKNWIDGPCTGDISKSFNADTDIYTYTITGFTGIIRDADETSGIEADTKCSATLLNTYEWDNIEYPTDRADYWHKKIATTLTITDPLKYMGPSSAYAFVAFDINYDEAQQAKWGDIYPDGWLKFTSTNDEGDSRTVCYINLGTGETDQCDGVVETPNWWIERGETSKVILNVRIWPSETKLALSYMGDDYFEPSTSEEYVPFTQEAPEIEIHNAVHTSDGKVYTDFTITDMGTLSEKYWVNQALRFGSKNGGKTCTYDLTNQAFDDGCSGTLSVIGGTFTLKDLANLYTAEDTEFSVTLITNDDYNHPESEFVHKEKNYGKLETAIDISNVLKVHNKQGFFTVDFTYEPEIFGRYGVEPGEILTFKAGSNTCTYYLTTEYASGCIVEVAESESTAGKIHLIVKGLPVNGGITTVKASYDLEGNDDFFAPADFEKSFDVDAHPVIRITEAVKKTIGKADVKLEVNSADYFAGIYGSFFEQIKIYTNSDRSSFFNIGDILKSNESSGTTSFVNPSHSGIVAWTREGGTDSETRGYYYTFTITDWTGPIDPGDWDCYAELVSHAYLEEADYPKDGPERFKHYTGSTEIEVSDVYAAQVKHIYLTAVMNYDPDIADSYNELPTGTLTINADGGTVKTCAFDLKADPATFDCGTVELDKTGHKATFVFRNYEVPGSVAQVSVKYNGDVYFNASDEGSGSVITADPEITIEYPIKTRETDYSNHGYVAFTIDGIGEGSYPEMYKIYPRIRLISRDSSNRRYCYFDRTTLSFTDNCEADEITLSGNQYIIKNLRGKVGGTNFIQSNDDYIGIALYPYGEGWTGETYSSYPMNEVYWWNRISIYGEMTDVIKYSRDHVAFTATLSLNERGQQAADFWGMSPVMASGSMEFKSGSATCTVDLATKTFTGCEGEVEVTGNAPVTIKVRNLRATDHGTSLYIAEYHPNRFFDHWQKEYVTFQNKIPAIAINTATKTSNTSANLEITVYGNEYADIYGPLYNRIRLAAHNDAYTEIDISGILAGSEASGTIAGTSGFEAVNWTRNGNNVTFNVTGWKENITADDTQCTAWLGNSDVSVLPIDHSPKSDPKDFDFAKGSITLTKKNDGLRSINDNAYLDVVLDYDPDTAAAFRKPSGTLKFSALDSTFYRWTKTCTFDVNYLGDLVCGEGGSGGATIIEKDDENHNVTIRLKAFHIYNAPSVDVQISESEFYTGSFINIPVTREIPVITISSAVRRTESGSDQSTGYMQFTIKTGPLNEIYLPFTRVDLYSTESSFDSGYHKTSFDFDKNSAHFTDPVTGDISVNYDPDTYTYTYLVKNMKGLIRNSDTKMRVTLYSAETGSVSSNEKTFENINVVINLSDLLVVKDKNNMNFAFGRMDYSFEELAKTFDLWPAGWMNVKSYWGGGSYRYGHINVETGALGSDARTDFGNAVFTPVKDETAHTLQIEMVDTSVHSDTWQFSVDYNDGSNGYSVDDAFGHFSTGNVSYDQASPGITITQALKHPMSVDGSVVPAADISFTLTGYDDLLDTWGVYRAIELRSKLGNTSGVCQINLPWDPEHPSTTCSGTVTKEGNTFSIKDWRGLTSSSDSSVEVALVSKYSDIAGARDEKVYEKTGLEVQISDALLMDSKYRFMKITLTPEDPEYSFALSDLRISSGETCKYNVSTGENTCGCRIEKTESGGSVQLIVEGWERTGSGLSYVFQATYLEDNYFYDAMARRSCDTVSLPTVEITNLDAANKTIDIRIDRYTDYFSKYSIIQLVGLRSFRPGNSSTTNFKPSRLPDGETTPSLIGNMMITRNGDAFHVANLPYVNGYTSMMVYLNSVPNDTGSVYTWFWPNESIYAEVPLISGFTSPAPSNSTSGAPVSISVGDLQPIGGQ